MGITVLLYKRGVLLPTWECVSLCIKTHWASSLSTSQAGRNWAQGYNGSSGMSPKHSVDEPDTRAQPGFLDHFRGLVVLCAVLWGAKGLCSSAQFLHCQVDTSTRPCLIRYEEGGAITVP